MKVKIGNREQIEHISLLIPQPNDAWIDFKAADWDIRIHLIFLDSDKESPIIKLKGKKDHAELTLTNWSGEKSLATDDFLVLGETDGKEVLFLVCGYGVPGFKKVELSFFWGEKNGQ